MSRAGLASLFAAAAARRPDAIAVTGADGRSLSYRALDRASEFLAGQMRGLGAGPDTPVALRMERSPALIVAMVAAMKAGSAYVPIDSGFPEERQAFLFEDSGAGLLVTDAPSDAAPWCAADRQIALSDSALPEAEPAPPRADTPDALAYVIYTSGSTGKPKGVMVPERGIVRLVRHPDYVSLGPDEVLAQASTVTFDAATFEIWGALLNGARVVIVPKATLLDGPALADVIRREGITTMFVTTALFNQYARESPEVFQGLGTLLFGGEASDPRAVRRVLSAGAPGRLVHIYGPTEVTTFALWCEVPAVAADATTIPIGRPISGTTAVIMGRDGRAVEPGQAGELVLGGPGVALGYRNLPELTAARFIAGQYATGDLVRENAGGDLEFIGRLDDQIKLRGYRIEPSEIARTLEEHAGVDEAVVVLREDTPGAARLVAYAIPRAGAPARTEQLLDYLRGRLPDFMVPSAVVLLDAFPLAATGKIDRAALPVPSSSAGRGGTPPRTPIEQAIAAIWSDVLAVEQPTLEDEFLRQGGNSLLAIRIAGRIRRELEVVLPFASLIDQRTLGDLARHVAGLRQDSPVAARPIRPVAREPFRIRRSADPNPVPPPPDPSTLLELLERADPEREALAAVDRAALPCGLLASQVRAAAAWLRAAGLGPGDTAALVLPNGPDMASAFLSAGIAGVAAPLNPAYRREEFGFYLDDLDARMLLIQGNPDSPARAIARERGIRIVEIGAAEGRPAGIFTLDGEIPSGAGALAPPAPDATALVLHTSGTTSRPKIVPLTHANLLASAASVAATLGIRPGDRCLNVMPLFHIHGLVAAVLASLRGGGSVVCTPGFLAPGFFGWLRQHRPTWYTAVPTIHQAILARAAEPANQEILRTHQLRFARSSSSALPPAVLTALEATLRVPVIEAYGMTEAAHQIASNPLPPATRRAGTVGRPAGAEVVILDPAGRRLGPGVSGEVAIRGPGVTRGYRDPEANARGFVDGWLRTGDEGVLDGDGYLTLTGRIKEQINRGGEKIAPLEVDRVLSAHPGVAAALCFAVPHPTLGEDIAAAVVRAPGAAVTERELREYVAGRLAYFKTPRQILFVDALPTGATGKPQRLGLAERLGVQAPAATDELDRTAPRTPAEEIVAAAWGEITGHPPPGIRRNFFALGGDSILATQLVSRLREQLAIDLSLFAVFDEPTVEGIARAVDALLSPEAADTGIVRRPARDRAPATSEQRLLWEIERAMPGTVTYNLPILRRIEGPVDLGALQAALQDLAAGHEAFRTFFAEAASGLEQRMVPAVQLPVELLDYRAQAPAAAEAAALAALADRIARPFDLARPPLCRVTIARVGDQDLLLLLTLHHLVCDGWSVAVIQRGLAEAYAARAAGQVPPREDAAPDFGDYAAWLDAPAQQESRRAHLDYWRRAFDGADLGVELPADHPSSPHPTFAGRTERLELPRELVRGLEGRAAALGTTLNVLLQSAFRILLYRLGGQEDLTFGTLVAGRDSSETERMIGYFARTVLIRSRVADDTTIGDLVQAIRSGILDALEHPASLEDLIGVLPAHGDWSFRLLFAFNEEHPAPQTLGDARLRPVPSQVPGAKSDLNLAITRRGPDLEAVLNARAALYDAESVRRFLHLYQTVLEGVASGFSGPVSRLSLFRPGEREAVLALAPGPTLATRVDRPIGELFLEQAERSAEVPALISEEGTWSFARLRDHALQLAGTLARHGVGRGDIVAIVADRRPETIMAMVAVALAGAAYLPIEPDQPADRIRGMLDDAGVRVVLADREIPREAGVLLRLDRPLDPDAARTPITRAATPDDPVYVIYTSGSTGRPKGVLVPHRALVNHMDWLQHTFPAHRAQVTLHRTQMSFDASIWEIWGSLLGGRPMVLAPPIASADPLRLGALIRAHRITDIQVVPSMLGLLLELDALRGCDSLRRVFCGGEAMSVDLARRFQASHSADLINLYGPSEVTIDATCWPLPRDSGFTSIPIGRPIANVRAYVLDPQGEPMPIGVPGELYLGGLGVSLGYLHRPELTAQRFLPDPFDPRSGARMYRTGDRARFRQDGTIEFLGRADDQIKVHGLRIEPGEIEAVVNARPEVLESAVGAVQDPVLGKRLVAWVVTHPGVTLAGDALREHMAGSLPLSLVPSSVVFLPALPRTTSGKVDRLALPRPAEETAVYQRPETPTEKQVAEAWAAAFGKARIGRHDDFFALGGHSLLAIRIASQLRAVYGEAVTLRTVLDFPSVQSLGAELDRLSAAPRAPGEPSAPKIARVTRVRRSTGHPPGTPS